MNGELVSDVSAPDLDTFLARAGVGENAELREEAERLFQRCIACVRPKALMRKVDVVHVDELRVDIAGERFESRCLSANLAGFDVAYAYIATCGTELDRFIDGVDGLSGYWIDEIKELALDCIVEEVNRKAAIGLGVEAVAAMNPGSGDVDVWPIDQQIPLFRLFPYVSAEIGVRLTKSMLMVPNKTVSGVLYPAETGWVSCHTCRRTGCVRRRAPFLG